MKKILVFIVCLLLVCAMPVVAFAEGETDAPIVSEEVEVDNSTTEEETPTEGEISPPETVPEATPGETPEVGDSVTDSVMEGLEEEEKEEIKSVADHIVSYIEAHLDSLSLFLTMILSIFYQIRKHASLNKSIGTLNNNAITVAENSSSAITKALLNMEGVSDIVTGYRTEINALLAEFRSKAEDKQKLEEDKQKLEAELSEIHKYLKLSKDANVEFANELAELLTLSNIPNYKKEELGARHLAAVHAIEDAEAKTENEEVKEDVGEKA